MTDAHTQQLAKKCLEQLEELVLLGKLDSSQLSGIRPHLDTLARPPPPAVVARKPPPVPSSTPSLPQCKDIWSYSGAEEDELNFKENDTIEIVEEADPAWWRGRVVHANGSRSQEGLFPSNYVEKVAQTAITSPALPPRNMPPVYTPSIASADDYAPSTYSLAPSSINQQQTSSPPAQSRVSMPKPYGSSDEKSSLGPAPWRPGVARWSSGAPPPPPPPPAQQGYGAPLSPTGSNQSYYSSTQNNNNHQQDMQTAGQAPGNPALYGTQQPVPNDPNKNDKMKKFGGRMGQTLATSFVGGVGFGVGSHLF